MLFPTWCRLASHAPGGRRDAVEDRCLCGYDRRVPPVAEAVDYFQTLSAHAGLERPEAGPVPIRLSPFRRHYPAHARYRRCSPPREMDSRLYRPGAIPGGFRPVALAALVL